MGTPGFAVAPLARLIADGYTVVGVVTAPDRPAGRGKKLRASEVKEFALSQGLNILQPTNLKDPVFIDQLKELRPDLQVVVAFRMLPRAVWEIPRLGTFNLHASLLPQYRGAAPINHALMNGESRTGVTTFLIDEQIDTGNILLREEISISGDETAGKLHDRLMEIGAGVVTRTAEGLGNGTLEAVSQEQFMSSGEELKPAPKIFKEHCRIHWDQPGEVVFNFIRGLSPYPTAFTMLEKKEGGELLCKIFSARFLEQAHDLLPGTLRSDGKRVLEVAVQGGVIRIDSIQLEGKRRMDTGDFLLGINLSSFLPRFS